WIETSSERDCLRCQEIIVERLALTFLLVSSLKVWTVCPPLLRTRAISVISARAVSTSSRPHGAGPFAPRTNFPWPELIATDVIGLSFIFARDQGRTLLAAECPRANGSAPIRSRPPADSDRGVGARCGVRC